MPQLPMFRVANTIITQLAANVAASDQIIPVGDVSRFPAAPNFATIGTDNTAEVLFYVGIDVSTSTLTGCLRGQAGTLPSTWEVGAEIYHAWTATTANNMMDNISDNAAGLIVAGAEIETLAEAQADTQEALDATTARHNLLEEMTLRNRFSAAIAVEEAPVAVLVDDDGTPIAADWRYKEQATGDDSWRYEEE